MEERWPDPLLTLKTTVGKKAYELMDIFWAMWGDTVKTKGLLGLHVFQVSSDIILRDFDSLHPRDRELQEVGRSPAGLLSAVMLT